MTKKPAPILPVMVLSINFSCVGVTVATLAQVAGLLRRSMFFALGTGAWGIAMNTTSLVRLVAKTLGINKFRGILVQSDIMIPMECADSLATAILQADKENVNFVVPAKTIFNKWNVNDGLTDEQYKELPNWTKIVHSGLNFYYGDLFADYTFHEGDGNKGEDWHFYDDNKIELRALKLPFKHIKEYPF
jgi:hypothetical protein